MSGLSIPSSCVFHSIFLYQLSKQLARTHQKCQLPWIIYFVDKY